MTTKNGLDLRETDLTRHGMLSPKTEGNRSSSGVLWRVADPALTRGRKTGVVEAAPLNPSPIRDTYLFQTTAVTAALIINVFMAVQTGTQAAQWDVCDNTFIVLCRVVSHQ